MTAASATPDDGNRFFNRVLVCAIAMSLVPMWVVPIAPLGDLPAHIEMMDIVARLHDPSTVFGETYRLRLGFIPNSVSLHAARVFGRLVPAHVVVQGIHSLYAITLPLSVLALARAFGRTRWAAVLACPIVFNAMFAGGFLNYVIALPALIFTIAAARVHGVRPSWRHGLALGLALAFLFLSHMIAFSFGFAIAATLLVLHNDRWRHLPARLVPLLVPIVPVALWLWDFVLSPAARLEAHSFRSTPGLGLSWLPRVELFLQIPYWALQFFRGPTDEIALAIMGTSFFGFVVLSLRRARRPADARVADAGVVNAVAPAPLPPARGVRAALAYVRANDLEFVIVCCLIAYFVLPSNMTALAVIAERVVSLGMLLLCALPRAEIDRAAVTRRWALGAIVVALAYPIVVSAQFVRHERNVTGRLPAMIAALPARSRLAYAMADAQNPVTWSDVLWHLPKALHAEANGGITDDSFARNGFAPVNYRAGHVPPRIGAAGLGVVDVPGLAYYDHLLVRSIRRPTRVLSATGRVRLRDHDGIWWLFDVDPSHRSAPPP